MTKPHSTIFPLVAISLLAPFARIVTADTRRHQRDEVTGHIPSTHEEIVAHRERKKDHFVGKLDEMKLQIENHKSGRLLLTKDEFERAQRKIRAYENKMEELNREFDERHSRRLMAREELLNEMTRARFASRDEL
jgi:peptidoglycan hydrolase CwlO-like protein